MLDFIKMVWGPRGKWEIALKTLPFIFIVVGVKLLFHYKSFELFSINPLFTSIIAATVFLMGFLISGVSSDFKESEKLPGEIAAALETIFDEAIIISKNKNPESGKKFMIFLDETREHIISWLYGKISFHEVMTIIETFNDHFVLFETQGVQPTFISRMKAEQNNLRKALFRIHSIKETEFVASAYALTEALAFLISTGLLFAKIEPFYESLFFVGLVVFLVVYMLFLIRDIEDPFEYEEKGGERAGEVSLLLLHELKKRFNEKLKEYV